MKIFSVAYNINEDIIYISCEKFRERTDRLL